jgi:hypothetical protein
MKPSTPKIGLDGFTRGTVTLLLCNGSLTRGTERFHREDRQSHQRDRVLNFLWARSTETSRPALTPLGSWPRHMGPDLELLRQ